MAKKWIEVKNKCLECGKQVIAKYHKGDDVGKCYAEATEICPKCAGYGDELKKGDKIVYGEFKPGMIKKRESF